MMVWLWQMVISLLVWLSADPHKLATEPARAAAAVSAARAAVVDQAARRDGVESVAKMPTQGCEEGRCKVTR